MISDIKIKKGAKTSKNNNNMLNMARKWRTEEYAVMRDPEYGIR